jgi:hypothetical protein
MGRGTITVDLMFPSSIFQHQGLQLGLRQTALAEARHCHHHVKTTMVVQQWGLSANVARKR